MWTDKNRAKYNRDHLRYPSDLTDDEWAYVEPLIPPAKRGGGKRRTDMRAVMNGVMYILSTGCQWRYIPKDFPPRSTLHDYFTWWHCGGTLDRIHHWRCSETPQGWVTVKLHDARLMVDQQQCRVVFREAGFGVVRSDRGHGQSPLLHVQRT